MKAFFIVFILYILFSGCNQKNELTHDILANNIDKSISPKEDFFMYANGTWIKNNPIPAEESSWGLAYLVQEELYERLKIVNEKALKSPNDATQKKIADFWTSGMDTVEIEVQGLIPLKPYLLLIEKVKDTKSIIEVAIELKAIGVGCLFDDVVYQDDKNSELMAYYLWQGGLGLPNRDYYFNTDNRTHEIRNKYVQHIANIFRLSGSDSITAQKHAKKVFEIEKALAFSSRKLEALRDPYANYNKFATNDLNKISRTINWQLWFSTPPFNTLDSVIVGQPEFFTALGKLIKEQSVESWRSYLKWHLLRTYSPYLNHDFVQERFDFYGKTLRGIQNMRPRWKRVLDAEEDGMGELLGQAFVKEYFNEKAKERYSNLVELIKESFKERIQGLTWMEDATKQKALLKLAAMKKKVGYPDKWKDFSGLEINKSSYVVNIINCNKWWINYNRSKLGKPVNRDEWSMTPQTYNAYYNPSNNEIVLPAGIFTVPGFRDEELDDALVFGYAGASTIGHEITHGFDDQGRNYDMHGNLRQWWSKEDEKKFNERAKLMVKQYQEYMPIETMRINGNATLGENIADLGAVLLGWEAFKKTEQYKSNKDIAGLSPAERFFLGYSLAWLWHERDEALANQLLTDVHSPAKYRVNGPLVNVDDFYDIFDIKENDKMYRPDSLRVRIW